jgi:predicted DsbA family dithiol-disulfide isomerase
VTAVPLQIDIVSDVVCPWCIIGYLQLQRALDQRPGQFDVSLRWHPFELNPDMPGQGQDIGEHMAMKYGATPAQSNAARQRLVALGESLGFHFDYAGERRIRNTFRAHQLLHWAGSQGQQTPLKLALFEAYFSRGEDVNDSGVLATVAGSVGLDLDEAAAVLSDGRFEESVRAEQRAWMDRDVYAVPAFFFDDGYPVPGAQEPDTFLRLLDRLYQRKTET